MLFIDDLFLEFEISIHRLAKSIDNMVLALEQTLFEAIEETLAVDQQRRNPKTLKGIVFPFKPPRFKPGSYRADA